MRNIGLEETQAGIKIAGRNINNLRYAGDNTLKEESKGELKSLLMKVKRRVKKLVKKLNIDILEISELKWIGMGELNSVDHYIYYCGQESLRRNGVDLIVNKRV